MVLVKVIEKEMIFSEDQTWFHNCHANTHIWTGETDYLVVFWAGTREGTPDQAIWLSRCEKGVWQDPVRIKYIYQLPHWNPVLHRSGHRIYLFYKVGLTVQTWYTMVSYSDDGGRTWSESVEAVPGDDTPRATVRNRILVASDGSWIAPTSKVPYNWGVRTPLSVSFSQDNGDTFTDAYHLETAEGEYSYPSVTAQGNKLNIFYTANRKTFVHCVLDVSFAHIEHANA